MYEYDLKDHLGNTRVTLTPDPNDSSQQTAKLLQENDYYAFGYGIQSTQQTISPKNEYLYNHKELQEETGLYDYGARFYDPVIARWGGVDPLAEKGRRLSPYVYGKNNPLIFVDPDGMKDVYFKDQTGDKSGRSRTEWLINQGLGGGGYANIDEKTGLLSININKKQLSGLSEEQKAFYGVLKAGMDSESPSPTTINIVANDSETFIGNYYDSKIDVADIEHFGNSESTTGADMFSVFGHEYTEQVAKQGLGAGTQAEDHAQGVAAEEKIKGVKRGPNNLKDLKDDKEGGESGKAFFLYTDKKTNVETTITIYLIRNNIQWLTRDDKK